MTLRPTAFLLVVLPLVALSWQSAAAQEHGAGEQPAAPEGPKAEPPVAFNDRAKLMEIQLPRNFKAEKFDEARGQLAHWIWPVEGGAIAGVTLYQMQDFMRAPLARFVSLENRVEIEGTRRQGDGWAEAAGIEEKSGVAVFERYVEKGGVVWTAQFVCHRSNLDTCRAVATAALESFKVVGDWAPKTLPDGWREIKVKDYVLQTECDEDKVKEAQGLVEKLVDMGKFARSSLEGSPVWSSAPVVKVIQNGTLFEDTARQQTGQVPDNAIYDSRGRALLVKWMSRNTQGFEDQYLQWAAAQLVSEHYGGPLPFWISGGLRMYVLYGYMDGGKPTKPDKDRMTRLRGTIGMSTRHLDKWFTTASADVPDTNQAFAELYAWHYFFRHAKQGKKFRKTYEQCLQVLHDTGDPAAAHAVWEGTDFDALHDEFKKWGDSLK